jgi:hypothetical protein
MDSDVVFNCGSESVIEHNLIELRFFICLSRFRENIKISKSVKREVRNIFRIHWRDSVQFLMNFVFLWIQSTFFGKFRIFADTEYAIWSSSGV